MFAIVNNKKYNSNSGVNEVYVLYEGYTCIHIYVLAILKELKELLFTVYYVIIL